MNKKWRLTLAKILFSLVSCLWSAFLPASVQAQNYWLHYGMTIGSTDSGTQNNSYDSGRVQTASLITTNLSGPGSVATASATLNASFGLLQLTADCSVNDPGWNGNGHISRFEADVGSGPDVDFQDWLTVTSDTLPAGTPVRIQIICVTAGYITPSEGIQTELDHTASSASADLFVERPNGGSITVAAAIGGDYETNLISQIVTNTVGSRFYFNSHIFAQGWAEDNAPPGFSGSVSTEITAQTYVSVLTPGASYVADSGTVYPALQLPPPVLNIQTTNSSVIVSWSTAYVDYALQQNSSLNPTAWSSVTNTVTQAGNQNEVIIPLSSGTGFYRLQQQ